jgi:hypothetical protein
VGDISYVADLLLQQIWAALRGEGRQRQGPENRQAYMQTRQQAQQQAQAHTEQEAQPQEEAQQSAEATEQAGNEAGMGEANIPGTLYGLVQLARHYLYAARLYFKLPGHEHASPQPATLEQARAKEAAEKIAYRCLRRSVRIALHHLSPA